MMELAIAWAGLVLLYDFTMWTKGIFERWYLVLSALPVWLGKPLGLCRVCCCFWLGLPFYYFTAGDPKGYFIFLGISQAIVIPYEILLLIYKNKLRNK